ncbi:hypothetical protein KbCgl_15850 [Corynebacterium glutamicum]|nr:hypothetical protein KbCgl_15850 [Corynebacterium glutamicum]
MFWVKHYPEGTDTLPFSLVSHSPKPPGAGEWRMEWVGVDKRGCLVDWN